MQRHRSAGDIYSDHTDQDASDNAQPWVDVVNAKVAIRRVADHIGHLLHRIRGSINRYDFPSLKARPGAQLNVLADAVQLVYEDSAAQIRVDKTMGEDANNDNNQSNASTSRSEPDSELRNFG